MLRHRIFQRTLQLTYYYSLLLGLFPTLYEGATLKEHNTRAYLLYSACVHSMFLAVIGLFSYDIYRHNYMPGEPVLQCTYIVTNVAKFVAILQLIQCVWWRRADLVATQRAYRKFVTRYRRFAASEPGPHEEALNSTAHQHINRRIERAVIAKFVSGIATLLLANGNFLYMHKEYVAANALMLPLNFVLFTILLTAIGQLYFVLCQLYRQFAYLNVALGEWKARCRLAVQLPHSNAALPALCDQLATLAGMHCECYRLAVRIFRLCEAPSAAIMLRLFMTNIRTVYQLTLLATHNSGADAWNTVILLALTAAFYCNAALLVAVIDAVLTACNGTGALLRDCNELWPQHSGEQLRRTLDEFHVRLGGHKLRYKVCGLFEFNRQTSLRYFLSVFVHVSVLVQFDLYG